MPYDLLQMRNVELPKYFPATDAQIVRVNAGLLSTVEYCFFLRFLIRAH